MKKALVAALATGTVLLTAGCGYSIQGPQQTAQTQQTQPKYSTPAPQYTPPKTSWPTAMDNAWDEFTASDQADMCLLYRSDADRAWAAFSKNGTSITKTQFVAFFEAHCS